MSAAAQPPPGADGAPLWINGAIRRGADAHLSLFDRGARDGEGLFETLRVERGAPFLWERHLERLVLSAAALAFPIPPSPGELRAGLDDLLAARGLADAAVRITVTRGAPGGRPPRAGAWIEAQPLAARLWTARGGVRALTSGRAFAAGPLTAHKTTGRLPYTLAREEARAAGCAEALLATREGEVLEGAASNVFVVRDGVAWTPPLAADILPGITRALVIERGAALGLTLREARLARRDLETADEVFLTNAIQGVVPLAALDGRRLPQRTLGERLAADLECQRAG